MRKLLSFCGGMIALGAALVAINPPSLAYLLIASTASAPPYAAGPGDITSFTAWYGLRAYTAAIAAAGTQKLINITRASDSHACDVLVATSGGLGLTTSCGTGGDNGQPASSFCNATTCNIAVFYDQTGGGRPLNSNGGNTFPTLVFNCINTTLPCGKADVGIGQIIETGGNFTPSSKQVTVSLVGLNQSGTASPIPFQENGVDNYMIVAAANTWEFNGGNAGSLSSTSLADDAFHAMNVAIDLTPNPSTFNGDGTETTSTNLNNDLSAGPIVMLRALANGVLKQTEMGFIDATTATLSVRSKLCDNQGTYWGTSKGTHCNSSGT